MRKNEIKIIKRIKIGEAEKNKDVTNVAKLESDIRIQLGNVVKDWISERHENSRLEKIFSDSNILAWKI